MSEIQAVRVARRLVLLPRTLAAFRSCTMAEKATKAAAAAPAAPAAPAEPAKPAFAFPEPITKKNTPKPKCVEKCVAATRSGDGDETGVEGGKARGLHSQRAAGARVAA